MARAETIESVGEPEGGGGGGGNGPVPCYNVCRMEVPRPLHTWPRRLNTNTSIGAGLGAIPVHPNHLRPLQAFCLSYSLPYQQPEAEEEPHTALSPSSTPPPTPPRHRRNERSRGGVPPSDFSGQQSGSDREEHHDASRRHGPLPDLLPQNEHPSWAAPHHQAPGGEAVLELDVMRVANQLRTIGDEFNTTVVRRARLVPRWRDWRDVYRGLLNFLTQTLSPLYRLT